MQRHGKFLAAAVAVALTMTGLAACSGNGGGGSDDKTLTVLNYWSIPSQQKVLSELFAKCKAQTGRTFKSLLVPQSDLITKATQLTKSGDAPAMILADNNNIATLADAGLLAKFDLSATKLKASDFVKGPYESGSYKGVQYGIPVGNNGEVIVYNKDLLDQAGITPPKSWADLTAAAKKLTVEGRYGFAQTFGAGETLTWNWLTQLWSNGGSLTDLGGTKSVQAADFWTSFIRDKTAPSASLDWQSSDIATQLVKGQIAMGQVGTWTLGQLLSDAKKAGVNIGITEQVSPDGTAPLTPFGGEVLAAGSAASGGAQKAVSQCLGIFADDPAQLAKWDSALGYLPSYVPAQAAVLKDQPWLQTLADQLKNSRGRTTEVGAAYADYTVAISTALQKIASGSESAEDAMKAAAASVK